MKITGKIDKNYVSEVDKFLKEFDERHPQRSASQIAEQKKMARIVRLRDNPERDEEKGKLWDGF